MNSNITLRVRSPKGLTNITSLTLASTFSDLKREIESQTGIMRSFQQIKAGYPPKVLTQPETAKLADMDISDGEALIVEENKTQQSQQQQPTQNKSGESTEKITENYQKKQEDYFKQIPDEQTPNKDGLIMIRKVIPSDNSCLFNSISYALENRKTGQSVANELRKIIAEQVKSDPEQFNEAVLGRTNAEYCNWIKKDTSWGGEIELMILSKHYQCQMVAINVQTCRPHYYGVEQNYKRRIFLLYDGIHYDVYVRNISEDMPEDMAQTIFEPNDTAALDGAIVLANQLRKKKQFTDLTNFTIQCGICFKPFKGEKEAMDHGKQTGHMNFQEVQK